MEKYFSTQVIFFSYTHAVVCCYMCYSSAAAKLYKVVPCKEPSRQKYIRYSISLKSAFT